jgi:hypothetical protein
MLAWVVLISGLVGSAAVIIITVIGGRVRLPLTGVLMPDTGSLPGAMAAALLLSLLALVYFVLLNAAADIVTLCLAIEANSRATAMLLRGEAQLSRVDVPWQDPGI